MIGMECMPTDANTGCKVCGMQRAGRELAIGSVNSGQDKRPSYLPYSEFCSEVDKNKLSIPSALLYLIANCATMSNYAVISRAACFTSGAEESWILDLYEVYSSS
jgi:hypothetical protein